MTEWNDGIPEVQGAMKAAGCRPALLSPALPREMLHCSSSLHWPHCLPLLHTSLWSAGPLPQREATRTWTKSSPNTASVWKPVLWLLDLGERKMFLGKNNTSGLSHLMVECCERARPSVYPRQRSPKNKSMRSRTFQELKTSMNLCWSWRSFITDRRGSKSRTRLCMYQADTTEIVPPRASQRLDFSRKAYSLCNDPSNNTTWPALIRSACEVHVELWQQQQQEQDSDRKFRCWE